ncbi:DUF4359 domain-containing protein [Chroococcidiopsis sp. FACHB-1243]|uniref:DUF4359 domain-containing protein n=1 Tax=Chroococcidiopsis sp. [FACHB-1243] TaxID=2692781 RepID=UPI00178135A5|nr:DUF4359 domain-containing protein [Chroococcidiopsis sp. [FACHB-1243]]MBD2303942.1 DUF4359 domain-containing protein [Chroococcidiopsis sp. [FACHB-1243]]
MKRSTSISYIGLAVLGGLGVVMALTNPDRSAYEIYAGERLGTYIKDEVCPQAPNVFGLALQQNCSDLVDSSSPVIQRIVANNTKRQNFLLFSIYTTDLAVGGVIPSYRFQTVGAMQNFFTYSAQKQ